MRRPWFKFYPADWRADPGLRMCSLASRGLWADLIGYLHEGEPYGHLTLGGGEIPSDDQIAILCGCSISETKAALAELEKRKVFSRSSLGAIFSRRMVRDNERSEAGREAVRKRFPIRKPNGQPNRSPTYKPNT